MKMSKSKKIKNSVYLFGYGAYGSAITFALSFNQDNNIQIYDPAIESHENIRNGISNKIIKKYENEEIKDGSYILLAIPSKEIDGWISDYKQRIPKNAVIVNLAKGFNSEGGLIFNTIAENFPDNQIITIKGPSFADEIKRGYPTLLTIAGNRNDDVKSRIEDLFSGSNIIFDYVTDYRGVEVLSVLKNIYSIFLGIVNAKYDGANTTFLAFTKSIKEIEGLLDLYECEKSTLLSSAGIGDFGLTGLNDMSRNRTFGLFVGKGFYNRNNKHAVLVEGVRSIMLVYNKANHAGETHKFPILDFMNSIFFKEIDVNTLNVLLRSL